VTRKQKGGKKPRNFFGRGTLDRAMYQLMVNWFFHPRWPFSTVELDAEGYLHNGAFLTAPAVSELAPQANLLEALKRITRDSRSAFEARADGRAFRVKPTVRYSQRQLQRRGLVATRRQLSVHAPPFVPTALQNSNSDRGRDSGSGSKTNGSNGNRNNAFDNINAYLEEIDQNRGLYRPYARPNNRNANKNNNSNTKRAIDEAVAKSNAPSTLLFEHW
jgi:hypothetical protein